MEGAPKGLSVQFLDEFFEAELKIQQYFGYKEDWVKIPIVGQREQYWMLIQDDEGGGEIIHHETPLTPELLQSGGYYSSDIRNAWVDVTDIQANSVS